jgi:hypothetical protein
MDPVNKFVDTVLEKYRFEMHNKVTLAKVQHEFDNIKMPGINVKFVAKLDKEEMGHFFLEEMGNLVVNRIHVTAQFASDKDYAWFLLQH